MFLVAVTRSALQGNNKVNAGNVARRPQPTPFVTIITGVASSTSANVNWSGCWLGLEQLIRQPLVIVAPSTANLTGATPVSFVAIVCRRHFVHSTNKKQSTTRSVVKAAVHTNAGRILMSLIRHISNVSSVAWLKAEN
jgi:hypothetical protein